MFGKTDNLWDTVKKLEERLDASERLWHKHLDAHNYNHPTRTQVDNYAETVMRRTTVELNGVTMTVAEAVEALFRYEDVHVTRVKEHIRIDGPGDKEEGWL